VRFVEIRVKTMRGVGWGERTVIGKFRVGTGWKMNHTLQMARDYARTLAAAERPAEIELFVLPPATALAEVARHLEGSGVRVGAQNAHWAEKGAWTGEISMTMLADAGASLVALGHSERRTHFNETDLDEHRKVRAALDKGLTPLVCVGETADEKRLGAAIETNARQARMALAGLTHAEAARVWLAYEPVWAIGEGGVPAAPAYADDRQARIVEVARGVTGRRVPCLYGGSVTAANCAALLRQPHVDGLFIGRAAWEVGGYLDILARCAAVLDATEGEADEDRDRR
jgi:triosephosphate isomerase